MVHFVNVGKNARVCVSKGGRFPPYSSEGKPPKKVGKGARDLTLCRLFHKKTCCDVAQTYPASLSVRRLASTGEASQECLQLWELLECSICDPQIGVQPGPPLICASFCDRVYQACASAYFSMDANKRVRAESPFLSSLDFWVFWCKISPFLSSLDIRLAYGVYIHLKWELPLMCSMISACLRS